MTDWLEHVFRRASLIDDRFASISRGGVQVLAAGPHRLHAFHDPYAGWRLREFFFGVERGFTVGNPLSVLVAAERVMRDTHLRELPAVSDLEGFRWSLSVWAAVSGETEAHRLDDCDALAVRVFDAQHQCSVQHLLAPGLPLRDESLRALFTTQERFDGWIEECLAFLRLERADLGLMHAPLRHV